MSDENKLFFQILSVFIVLFYVYYFSTKFNNVPITVKKDMIQTDGQFIANIIGTTDGRVFKVSTNPLILAFNASELINTLDKESTYLVSGYGRRVPMLGLYPEITAVKKV
jgi:hypothetical protein